MNLNKLNIFENFCCDIDCYGVSDNMRQLSAKEIFKNVSAPQKRAASQNYDVIAASMRNDAIEMKSKLDNTYLPVMNAATDAMAGKLLFTDFPNLSREKALLEQAAAPYYEGVTAVNNLYSEGEGYSRQASQLRWSARKDEFVGIVHNVGGKIKAALRLN